MTDEELTVGITEAFPLVHEGEVKALIDMYRKDPEGSIKKIHGLHWINKEEET